jgi:hypothetical protein
VAADGATNASGGCVPAIAGFSTRFGMAVAGVVRMGGRTEVRLAMLLEEGVRVRDLAAGAHGDAVGHVVKAHLVAGSSAVDDVVAPEAAIVPIALEVATRAARVAEIIEQ